MAKQPDEPRGRRDFFRNLFLRGLDKVEEAGKKIGERMAHFQPPEPPAPAPAPAYDPYLQQGTRYLRPPGALPQYAFTDTCSRCGDCVKACPAQCIKLDPAVAGGAPYIIARESPCVVCESLACMAICPSGALQKLDNRTQIQMGSAMTDHGRCLRGGGFASYDDPTTLQGEDCKLCVAACPIGETALVVDGHGTVEVRHGCIGCGVCERACPTEPASIWIEPW